MNGFDVTRSPVATALRHVAPLMTRFEQFCLGIAGLLVSGFLLVSCGQEAETSVSVPGAVQSAFAKKYPGVSPAWHDQPYGYEGVFTQNGVEYEAEYSFTGQWLETEYEVSASQFPQIVRDRVQQDYPGYAITKYEIELTPQGIFYELEIQKGGNESEIYYDSQGNPSVNSNEDA